MAETEEDEEGGGPAGAVPRCPRPVRNGTGWHGDQPCIREVRRGEARRAGEGRPRAHRRRLSAARRAARIAAEPRVHQAD
eukprot:13110698-Alexandrium_andersonii.AAC.1